MSTAIALSTDTVHAAAPQLSHSSELSSSKRARISPVSASAADQPPVNPVADSQSSILRRFMQLGVSARCTCFEYLPNFATASQCLGHVNTTADELHSMVYDLVSPSLLLWGDTTQLPVETQAKLIENVGEVTPTKGMWRGTLFTWLPDAYVSIALLQVEGGFTLVYLPSVKEFYFASDVTMLPRETPAGTVLIGVYTEDEREHFRVPRVLIHDVLAWGDTFETSRTPLDQRAAVTRYKLLRERLIPLIANQRYLLLQWCGFLTAAKQFLSGEVAVGHRVGGLVAILDGTAGAPCALSQEVAQHMQQGAS